MAGNILKTNWHILSNDLKERWPDLTEKDLSDGYRSFLSLILDLFRHFSVTVP